ncbi:MAG TPA: phosphoribosylaminoimidazolesuccinocarboxamide synthase [Candidatus Aminicenantes bacterium]|nr:phosphoribosylaminoimidazolesuccinocarboxamide synthase [Candidatus Aminicenantes bacterium]HRY63796.1 phosphoribosylaminoimidazolesuccinocarboxamide synthase [Candidatus Aminicenantes bacterium]HRZ70709.1 phosphoribosylaminoimidazolesuccinocarboxamide synthase [Candidatus Aminicenantes bacterium]
MEKPIGDIELPGLPLFRKGKVRDVFEVDDKLLIVATDRISAFDWILPSLIPYKGKVLTQLSKFWFDFVGLVVPNHLIATETGEFPPALASYAGVLAKRSMLVKRTKVVPIECVVRGYLSGSGWKEYKTTGKVCGIRLPKGLRESDQIAEPIFTPSTKAEKGHDVNISFKDVEKEIGAELAGKIRRTSLELYQKAALYAVSKGIIIADTKFEFGLDGDELILIDEIFTPDSSRFWPLAQYEPGRSQPSLDKQFVRDYLETTAWDKNSPPPELPAEIVAKTAQKYLEIYKVLTGLDDIA